MDSLPPHATEAELKRRLGTAGLGVCSVRLELNPISGQASGRGDLTFRNAPDRCACVCVRVCVCVEGVWRVCAERQRLSRRPRPAVCPPDPNPDPSINQPVSRRVLLETLQAHPQAVMGARLLQFTYDNTENIKASRACT